MYIQKATIHHTENTLRSLFKFQDRVCHPVLNYIGGAGCVILVILTIMMEPYIGKITVAVFSFIGCWLFVTNRYRPRQLYENAMKNFNGIFPIFNYTFKEDSVEIERNGKHQSISYNQISYLAESTKYCFFVYLGKAAFMFEKASVDNSEQLISMLSKKTNLSRKKASGRPTFKFKHNIYGGK